MDSINRNQAEDTLQNLNGQAAIDKIQELVERGQNCFFCTAVGTGPTDGVRPMNVRKLDERGDIWFLSAVDSHQNLEIANNPSVRLYFQGSRHSDFLYLNGNVTISTEQEVIDDLWEPTLSNWFTEGRRDPRITALQFTPSSGYYWDTKHGQGVTYIKMLLGAALGRTLDDSLEGRVEM
jgi:general stress protein 26